ncbi:MAG: protein BatD, partial [Methylococcales bacterium]|nr:protein BatD [Methylococcales bacterium]
PVSINESFQIIFTATESPDDDPDFSPLEKDFEILNQSHRSNSSWINGQSTKSIQWILNVMAKQTGNQLISPITFGKDVSQPATILVTKSSTPGNNNKNDDLFLEVEISPESPYVQSQVLYTLRLFRRVQIAQASLNEPVLADAIIEKLGEDKNYNTELNGVSYAVTERKYAIFPQKSGISTIEPLVLTAEVVSDSRSRFNGFFNRQITKTKRVSSRAITLNIQAAPDDFSGKRWIPAEQVYIEEKWSGDTSTMKPGEPLTRTLTIFAKGTTVAQLPQLHSTAEIAQLKTYPDQPTLKEQKRADGLLALREEKIAYIPSKSGDYSLPAIEIPWFNVQTQKMEMARIPEKTVTAIASVQSQTNDDFAEPTIQTNTVNSEPVILQVENKFWMWLAIFLALGWLITTFFFIRKLKPKSVKKPVNTKEIKLKETIKALKQACAENDQLAAKEALLNWGRIKFNSNSLSATASHCEARLRDEITLLNQTLYADKTETWQGKKLFQFFTENNAREKVAKKIDDSLEPLYKM